MKLKILLTSLIIVWGTGCIAYVQHPDEIQVAIEPPRTIITVVPPAPVVRHVRVQRTRHVHVQRTRPVVRHVHVQRTRHIHRHTRSCSHATRRATQTRRTRANQRRTRRTQRRGHR